MKLLSVLLTAITVVCTPAIAQFQVPNHGVPIGRGIGVSGFGAAAAGAAGLPFVGNGPLTDPSFQALPNAGLVPVPANTLKGATAAGTPTDIAVPTCNSLGWAAGSGFSCPPAPALVVTGGSRIGNFRAANTVGSLTTSMSLTADYVTFANPATGAANTITAGLSQNCAINSFGAGARDQAGVFLSGQTIWFYYIWGSGPGVSCVTSTAAPASGPNLTLVGGGYTSYAQAFPIILVGSATLVPAAPQGGTVGGYLVRGNVVTYIGQPLLCNPSCGFPTSNAPVGNWIPSIAQETWYFIDVEAGVASSILVGGFVILGGTAVGVTTWSYGPGSLYIPTANIPTVNNAVIGPYPYPTSGNVQVLFCSSAGALGPCAAGTITQQEAALIGVIGYSFAQ